MRLTKPNALSALFFLLAAAAGLTLVAYSYASTSDPEVPAPPTLARDFCSDETQGALYSVITASPMKLGDLLDDVNDRFPEYQLVADAGTRQLPVGLRVMNVPSVRLVKSLASANDLSYYCGPAGGGRQLVTLTHPDPLSFRRRVDEAEAAWSKALEELAKSAAPGGGAKPNGHRRKR